jgi:C-terminal processing protease CtpA/Prc
MSVRMLPIVRCLIRCLLAAASAQAQPGPTYAASSSLPPAIAQAGPVATAYLALVRTSIVPADPRTVASAALGAMEAAGANLHSVLPEDFGRHADRDAVWLMERTRGAPSPWPIVNAMARATGTAHVGLGTPALRKAMQGLVTGMPVSAPGLGVCRLEDGRFAICDVVPGASAQRSGLRAGDVLLRIGDETVTNQATLLPIVALPAGEQVRLTIEREGHRLEIVLMLVQAEVSSVESRLLGDAIGYVRIRWFSRSQDPARDTAALARNAFAWLAAQGARALVLDLRSALGGVGDVSVASALCDGNVVYHVRDPMSEPAKPVPREGPRIWPQRPIVVLVNDETVSAGETLALAVRELSSAMVIGRPTAGGLTEASFIALGEERSLLIPTGVVLGPLSRQDQPGHAIRPDIEVNNPSVEELSQGRDRQLEAARELAARAPFIHR